MNLSSNLLDLIIYLNRLIKYIRIGNIRVEASFSIANISCGINLIENRLNVIKMVTYQFHNSQSHGSILDDGIDFEQASMNSAIPWRDRTRAIVAACRSYG